MKVDCLVYNKKMIPKWMPLLFKGLGCLYFICHKYVNYHSMLCCHTRTVLFRLCLILEQTPDTIFVVCISVVSVSFQVFLGCCKSHFAQATLPPSLRILLMRAVESAINPETQYNAVFSCQVYSAVIT